MLRNITDFARGFVLGLVVGGSAGLLMAPEAGKTSPSAFQARLEAVRTAFEEGRERAEKELLDYFEQAKQSSGARNLP